MRQDIEALHQLARIAIQGLADEKTLAQAVSVIRQATEAAEAMVVYADDKNVLTCAHDDGDSHTELTPPALAVVQRQAAKAGEPVAFNLKLTRVEDFTNAHSEDDRQFLAFAIPTSQSPSEMCIIHGACDHKSRPSVLSFVESATPALVVILERFLNAERGRRLAEQLNTLANAAQMLTQSEDVESALTDLVSAIATSAGPDYVVSIDLYDPTTDRFYLRTGSEYRHSGGTLTKIWRASLNPDQIDPWNVEVMTTRQPTLKPDMQNDPVYPEHVRKFFAQSFLRSTANFPLLFQDEFLGTMSFASFKPHTFPPEEVSLLQGLVSQAASALKAMQMHKEVQRYAQELRRSADEYIATTNLTGDVICRLDQRGRWTFLNDGACQFFGKPREELLGTNSRDFLHPDEVELTAQAIRQMIADKKPVSGFVNRHITPKGTRVVEWNGYPLFDDDGQYTGIQITGRDITERKQAEEALQEAKEFSDGLITSMQDGCSVLDSRGVHVDVNPAFCQMTGFSREDLIGVGPPHPYWPPEAYKEIEMAFQKTLRGEFAAFELTFMRKNGERFPAIISPSSVKDNQGNVISYFATLKDITERKQMEDALQESEESFRLLFENAKDAIFHADPGTGLITKCNRAAETLLEKDREEIIGQPQTTIHPPQKAEHYIQMFKRHLEQQGFAEDEAEVITKSGKTKPVLITASVASVRGTPVMQGAFRDITERKRLEAERERLHAEMAERAITDGLTGLYNHAHFFQRLAEEIERSKRYKRRFAVVMMDVDAFKHYNDSRGHQAGDDALRLLADCIRTGIRGSDLAFRYGGDEFAAILLNADSARAQAVVNRINRHIASGLKKMDDQAASWLGLSAGVAAYPEDATTPDELVQMADAAMYNAKRLAWARGLTEPEQAIESHPYPHKLMHETQAGMLTTAAGSLATVLQDLGVSEVAAALDLRSIAAVGAASEIKDRYIRGHQERASLWAAALAEEMGLPSEQVRNIRIAGLLHDIGKVSINEGILNKPGKLTEEEFNKVKRHAPLGAEIMLSEAEALQQLAAIVRYHHEHFDGTGYPDRIAGEQIPLEARIMAVVDVFDAMTHERSYRKALSREDAIAELEHGAGTQFDPVVVKAFLALLKRRSDEPAAPAQGAHKDRRLAAARAAAPRRG